ncbi:unnamed protein product [Prorocentrum cordatum]|uniref:Uncharacterized protein n=1 Tax=Prorocentrum cordatum TaxID=2364126 RepID=A0ABN9WNI9_9DINO|nr:unnamed protein product [Polarella glacialis]
MGRVEGEAGEFLAYTACFMYARTPKMCWRGLRDARAGAAASRARKGSRAQVRNRWAETLGLAADGDLAESAVASASAVQDAEGERPAKRQRTATAAAGGGTGASNADGVLILPPAESVAATYGFASAEEARARGASARLARAQTSETTVATAGQAYTTTSAVLTTACEPAWCPFILCVGSAISECRCSCATATSVTTTSSATTQTSSSCEPSWCAFANCQLAAAVEECLCSCTTATATSTSTMVTSTTWTTSVSGTTTQSATLTGTSSTLTSSTHSSTLSSTTSTTSTPRYVDGPNVGNNVWDTLCQGPPTTLDGAALACNALAACSVVAGFGCLGGALYKACAVPLEALLSASTGSEACTQVRYTAGAFTGTITETQVSTSTMQPVVYSAGPRVGNNVVVSVCQSLELSREAAETACSELPGCEVIVSFQCAGVYWYVCDGSLDEVQAQSAGTEACTYVAGYTSTTVSTPTSTSSRTSASTSTATSTVPLQDLEGLFTESHQRKADRTRIMSDSPDQAMLYCSGRAQHRSLVQGVMGSKRSRSADGKLKSCSCGVACHNPARRVASDWSNSEVGDLIGVSVRILIVFAMSEAKYWYAESRVANGWGFSKTGTIWGFPQRSWNSTGLRGLMGYSSRTVAPERQSAFALDWSAALAICCWGVSAEFWPLMFRTWSIASPARFMPWLRLSASSWSSCMASASTFSLAASSGLTSPDGVAVASDGALGSSSAAIGTAAPTSAPVWDSAATWDAVWACWELAWVAWAACHSSRSFADN